MAGSSGYAYIIRLPITSITTSKTLLQIRCGAAPIDIMRVRLYQKTQTAVEYLEWRLRRYDGAPTAGTVTAAALDTPVSSLVRTNPSDPAPLLTLSTSGTGYNATAEPTGGTAVSIVESVWSLQVPDLEFPIPENRRRIPQAGLATLYLVDTPAAARSIGAEIDIIEYR